MGVFRRNWGVRNANKTNKPEQANARTKAIAEYRAGLVLDDKSEVSIIAKERLHGLQAGEAPHDTSFYCQIMD